MDRPRLTYRDALVLAVISTYTRREGRPPRQRELVTFASTGPGLLNQALIDHAIPPIATPPFRGVKGLTTSVNRLKQAGLLLPGDGYRLSAVGQAIAGQLGPDALRWPAEWQVDPSGPLIRPIRNLPEF